MNFTKNSSGNAVSRWALVIALVLVPLFGVALPAFAASSITITSPNGGEQWLQGSTHTITWTSVNISSNSNITISLLKVTPTSQTIYSITTVKSFGDSGSYAWVVPLGSNYDSALGGKFKISVGYIPGASYDLSDNYFSIVTSTNATLQTPVLITSPTSTTPNQYIAAGNGGAVNASRATYIFTATGGSATITQLKFSVNGSDGNPSNTVTNVCVGTVCAQPVNGVAYVTGLNLNVPNGGAGLTQSVLVSYASIGINGIASGTTSTIALTYAKYVTVGTTKTLTSNVPAPTMTLVGSKPTLVVANGGASGMNLNQSTKVGQVTVTADSKGSIKIRKITFNLAYSGYNTNPTSLSSAFISDGTNTFAITGSACTATGIGVESCSLGNSYATDYLIAAGQSQQFNLYVTTTGGASSGGARIWSNLGASGFIWDDTSTNGATGSTGLTGALLYGFPVNSYYVSQ